LRGIEREDDAGAERRISGGEDRFERARCVNPANVIASIATMGPGSSTTRRPRTDRIAVRTCATATADDPGHMPGMRNAAPAACARTRRVRPLDDSTIRRWTVFERA
jgi:hypothetical protein